MNRRHPLRNHRSSSIKLHGQTAGCGGCPTAGGFLRLTTARRTHQRPTERWPIALQHMLGKVGAGLALAWLAGGAPLVSAGQPLSSIAAFFTDHER